jgi:hypothetical protein
MTPPSEHKWRRNADAVLRVLPLVEGVQQRIARTLQARDPEAAHR